MHGGYRQNIGTADRLAASTKAAQEPLDFFEEVSTASTAMSRAQTVGEVLEAFADALFALFPIDMIETINAPGADAPCTITSRQWRGLPLEACTDAFFPEQDLARALQNGAVALVEQPASAHGGGASGLLQYIIPMRSAERDSAFFLCTISPPVADCGNWKSKLEILAIICSNARERIEARQEVDHQLHHDSLTGLYNRAFFSRWFDARISSREPAPVALILADLDKFKQVNDCYGHLAGDATLIRFGEELTRLAGDDAIVARLGGDEFAVLLPLADDDPAPARQLLERLRRAAPGIELNNRKIEIGFSAGMALYPADAGDRTGVMRKADLGLYAAKESRTERAFHFDNAMALQDEQNRALVSQFKHALEYGEIVPFYQILVNLRTGRVEGLEALARWNHPQRGILTPGQFHDVFKEPDLASLLAQRMFACVANDICLWRETGVDYQSIGVNIELCDQSNRDLFDNLKATLAARDIPLRDIAIEVTEHTELGPQSEAAMEMLREMRAHGMYIALDGFGVGYSSLTNLKRIPLTAVKLDRTFVQNIARDRKDHGKRRAETVQAL